VTRGEGSLSPITGETTYGSLDPIAERRITLDEDRLAANQADQEEQRRLQSERDEWTRTYQEKQLRLQSERDEWTRTYQDKQLTAQGVTAKETADFRAATLESQHKRDVAKNAFDLLELDFRTTQAKNDRETLDPEVELLSVNDKGEIDIQASLKNLGLTSSPSDQQIYNRMSKWVTGPLSKWSEITGPFLGDFPGLGTQKSVDTRTALDMVVNIIATAMQQNDRLPEGERKRVLESINLETGFGKSPDHLRGSLREVDKILRLMLTTDTDRDLIDNMSTILRAIDLIGAPQDYGKPFELRFPADG